MRWWKWVGLAGVLAAVGTGALLVQRRRTRTWTEYEPDEIRDRLRARLAESAVGPDQLPNSGSSSA